jgi:MFS family permease
MARSHTLRSLRHRDYRLYYIGQLVSLHGTRMQLVAQAWLVYRLTESSLMLGLVSAAAMLPSLVLGLLGGVLADRLHRQRLLILAQAVAMVQALALGILTLSGAVEAWHVMALALALGAVQAIEIPVRYSFIAGLVPRDDLPNAVALNSSMFHLARFVAPPIAGVLVALVGEGAVFVLNAFTFMAVIGALAAIRTSDEDARAGRSAGPKRLRDGLTYAWNDQTIRGALSIVAVLSVLGSSAAVLMPVFAADVFRAGPGSLGLLLGALGVGALGGALRLAQRRSSAGLGTIIVNAATAAGLVVVVFAFVPSLWLALLVLPLAGFTITTAMASSNALIQLTVPDALRGRVMSLYSVSLHGMMPLGALAVGASAEWFGAAATVAASGVLLVGAVLLVGPVLRRAERARS